MPKEPWIRYRVELRDQLTDNLLSQRDVNGPNEIDDDADINMPVFELVTTYQARGRDGEKAVLPVSTPSYHVNIYSAAIIHALHNVVKYYPSQDLFGNPVVVKKPYAVLAHHYDELSAFREECATRDPARRCAREAGAYAHLGLLLKFLDEHVMKDVRVEMERNKKGLYTWEWAWVTYRPGTSFLDTYLTVPGWQPHVVHSIQGGMFDNPPTEWKIFAWDLHYDGTYVGRRCHPINVTKFDGETNAGKMIVIRETNWTDEVVSRLPKLVSDQISYGRQFWNLLRKQCKQHKGKSRAFPHNEIDGLVMLDLQTYYAEDVSGYRTPDLMDTTDCRTFVSDCPCSVCRDDAAKRDRMVVALFEDYNSIDPTAEPREELTNHQFFLCQFEIAAFVFKTRKWEPLHVSGFSEPDFDEGMIDGLVMNEGRKNTLKALSKAFARRNRNNEQLSNDMWAADFVKGKGSGLIFLLHGKPGVGKTCTAECISAFTKRPLMVLTPSDIGTSASEVELHLTRNFKTARSWDAVLLIDEADVFMERRTTADLVRNSLVAGFLRALENYDGILFLTTNRVGAFDDAFISRIHVQLFYDEFTDSQRQEVWQTFIRKLARERGDSIRLNIDAKEYIRGSEMRAVKWNGREIRNAFQTAVALAEYGADKDEDGKILVTDTHLRAVVELSRDFKDYVNELHRGDEAKRAARKYERLDDYSSRSGTQ
ncbi:P-loop containing nucleoside triphosphate hydrolase protein [Podospora appendiculata]|uniref:P-loop containing nucleoside triphosphate hydrolase protein n=1 Tax=Podospora appendiculata TaxID=314037 RepID=A0AAE1C8V2_9PEZI|nr:P-loop containing nucleoside triphosphate hydrolase protein [Podospora appendiculata]